MNKYAKMFTKRSDGRYQGYYRDADGKRRAVCDRDPERLFRKLEDLRLGAERPHETTFGEIAERWEREHREEIEARTWNNYRPHFDDLIGLYGTTPIAKLEPGEIAADLKRQKIKGLSRSVVNARRSIWRMIYDCAVIAGAVQYNPVASVKLPKGLPQGKRQAPTEEQMRTICRSVGEPFGLFAFLLLCSGLRKAEALALTWSDLELDCDEPVIHVTKALDYTNSGAPTVKAPKTEAGVRDVPIIEILLEELQKARRAASGLLLFPAPASSRGGAGGGWMPERAYDGAWSRYCEAAGLVDEQGRPVLTAHNLRHGTATLLFEFGVDELTTQRILGHSRIEITREIYTDLRAGQKKRSVGRFDRGMAKLMAKSG